MGGKAGIAEKLVRVNDATWQCLWELRTGVSGEGISWLHKAG